MGVFSIFGVVLSITIVKLIAILSSLIIIIIWLSESFGSMAMIVSEHRIDTLNEQFWSNICICENERYG